LLRSIATVLSANLIAQALGLAALPFLTRLFPAEAFAHYQFFLSFITLLGVPAGLRYELALLRAGEGGELRAVLWLCFASNCGVAFLVAIAAAAIELIQPFWLARVQFPLFLLPLALLIGSVANTMSFVLIRNRAYLASGHSKVTQSATFVGLAGGIGVAAPVSSGLAVADIGGRAALAGYSLFWIARNAPALLVPASMRRMAAVARRYREYPLISAPGTLINSAGSVMTPLVVYALFAPAISGQFALVERSLTLPLALVISAASQVFTAEFASHLRSGSTAALHDFRKLVLHATVLGFVPAVALIVAGPDIFAIVFGAEWRLAGEFSRYLAVGYWSALAFGPINATLVVMGRQKLQLVWEVVRLAGMAALAAAVAAFDWPALYAVIGYSALMTVSSISFIFMAFFALRKHVRADGGKGDAATGVWIER
jgi:O-antigen/teichoic acid export membrane protein